MRRHDMVVDPGDFIAIYGPGASGKSTLARGLGERLNLPVLSLDSVYHGPHWQSLDRERFRACVRDFLGAHPEGWIIEGNYTMVQDLILNRASTVIWLRLPFWRVYPRLIRRTARWVVLREELDNENRETIRTLFTKHPILWWGIKHWRAHHDQTRALLRDRPRTTALVVLRNPAEVRRWFDAMAGGRQSRLT